MMVYKVCWHVLNEVILLECVKLEIIIFSFEHAVLASLHVVPDTDDITIINTTVRAATFICLPIINCTNQDKIEISVSD